MILAVRKTDGAVFEHFACDGLAPIMYIRDLAGKEYQVYDRDYKVIFENNPKYNEYLQARV